MPRNNQMARISARPPKIMKMGNGYAIDAQSWNHFLTQLANTGIRSGIEDSALGSGNGIFYDFDSSGNLVFAIGEFDSVQNLHIKYDRANDTRPKIGSVKISPHVQSGNVASVASSTPLTATDAGSDATINIAAHTAYFHGSNVAYSSGSVSGLNFSTKYRVYAEDPDYGGGAVTYLATTSPNTPNQTSGRRHFGTITTPANGAGDTSGIDLGGVSIDTGST